jgi:hypothetical protein
MRYLSRRRYEGFLPSCEQERAGQAFHLQFGTLMEGMLLAISSPGIQSLCFLRQAKGTADGF